MPWKETGPMDERVKFVSRLLEGERMTDLCQEFQISRKTGYKFLARYEKYGASGLHDLSRRPKPPALTAIRKPRPARWIDVDFMKLLKAVCASVKRLLNY